MQATNQTEKKNITIYTQKLAGYLMLRGFVLIATEPGKNKSGRNVFFFKNTPELRQAVKDYTEADIKL